MFLAVISFGSNYEAKFNLIEGLKALSQQVQILTVSPVYENPAVGKATSLPYLNGVCLIETNLPPLDLHEQVLRSIEDSLGRIRGEEGKVKCSLDLDLVLYDQEILSTQELELPAADILRYAYVAVPLALLVPDWIHPVTKQTMAQIAKRFSQHKASFHHRVDVNIAIANILHPKQWDETPVSVRCCENTQAMSGDKPLCVYALRKFSQVSMMKRIQPWHWRKLPLAQRSGSQVFAALFLNRSKNTESLSGDCRQNIATLLESPGTSNTSLARYSICAGSPRYINGQPQLWTPPVGEILPFLRRLLNTQPQQAADSTIPFELPFTGGWLGWLGYDLAWEIEQLPQLKADPLPFPIAYWYEPESFAVLDHQQQILWLATTNAAQLDAMECQLKQGDGDRKIQNFPPTDKNQPVTPTLQMSQEEYIKAVQQAKKYIQAGDIFQANLSLRFEAHTPVDSWSIYRALQQINPSPFASYWRTPWGAIISCSPERLIELSGRKVQTRPIAGTRSRGVTPTQDEQLAQELIANTKERAEHIMLVDLERNDIGRVCEWGTVKVDELLTIERYSHVMHLVSNVIGTLKPNYNAVDLIRAVSPGGTITGCPKVRCLEIIEELEPVKRNLFYGSCGYLDWRGNLDLNILIRTLLYTNISDSTSDAIVWGQVGAGIVADSDPQKEWHESLNKAQAQLKALELAFKNLT
ncbi:anthranilate synthase component I [Nostoc sp. CENA67]|uniref:Anthranilate synthase component 1 n=2 Tax=Amazonocrinis TaxID=2840440 RepID=A0A8J7LAD3_9NOST|nr:anthranilate synthase component I [Amazonocrinis nigriterrae CENA67]